MPLRRLSLLALPLALALPFVLSACGEKSEPTGASIRLYPVSVHDADGRAVTLRAKPESIAVAGAPEPELHAARPRAQTTSANGERLGVMGTGEHASTRLRWSRARAARSDLLNCACQPTTCD